MINITNVDPHAHPGILPVTTLSGELVPLSTLKIIDPNYLVQTYDDIWRGQCIQAWAQLKYLTPNNLSHTDIATYIRCLSSDLTENVIAFSQGRSSRKVYVYKQFIGLWVQQTDEYTEFDRCIEIIRRRLTKEVIEPIKNLLYCKQRQEDSCSETLSECSSSSASSPVKLLKTKLKLYNDFNNRLGDDTFKSKAVNQLIKQFIRNSEQYEHSPSIFDQKSRCLGFNDGVYDFEHGRLLTGKEAKEYYVTQTVGYNYDNVINVSEDVYQSFQTFINQILPDEDIRTYFFKRLNKSLQKVVEKLVLILYNKTGDNGKTVLLNLIDLTFGDLYVKANNNLIKKDAHISASGPNEELMSLKGKSLACFSEASGTLNMSLLKEIIGGDKISTRGNHEKKQTFFSKVLLVILCNALPSPDAKEKATFKKLRCIPFEAEFVDHPLKVNEAKYRFLRDENISDNFEEWKYACMKYILSLTNVEMSEPNKVTEHSRKYREKEDILFSFIQEVVEDTHAGILRRTNLWDQWKCWSKEENTSMKKSEFNENIMDYMNSQGFKWYEDTCDNGIRVKYCWRGCRLRSDMFQDDYDP